MDIMNWGLNSYLTCFTQPVSDDYSLSLFGLSENDLELLREVAEGDLWDALTRLIP